MRRRLRARYLATLVILIGVVAGVFALWSVRDGNGSVNISSTKKTEAVAETELPPVQVLVTKMVSSPTSIRYSYTVVNGSAFPITDLIIGFDHFGTSAELTYAPVGSDGPAVPDSSYKAPPGWIFKSVPTSDDTVGSVTWEIARPSEAILGGMSVGGFQVTVPHEDTAYESGHWTVYLDTSEDDIFSGVLQSSGVSSVPMSSLNANSDLKIGPSPARASISIQFIQQSTGPVSVDVFDVRGRLVKRILNERVKAGPVSITWDGRNQSGTESAAGIYFVRVKTPSYLRFGRLTRVPTRR